MQKVNEESGELMTSDTNEFIWRRNSKNVTIDEEDRPKITGTNWKNHGIINIASPIARAMGEKLGDFTPRGERKETHYQRQKYDYIE